MCFDVSAFGYSVILVISYFWVFLELANVSVQMLHV